MDVPLGADGKSYLANLNATNITVSISIATLKATISDRPFTLKNLGRGGRRSVFRSI